ncbi:unnamed protein product [Ilex paraguariensis]|uniref:Uncharacterized protein n=1 Tax=Ilex paraguariensis TaxID=185542 RepID=A0ABC8RP10_9AQUA
MLHTIGLEYLPVSTYSLICASQLGFNALFSYFLNAQKFTPFIVNSLFLLTISSALLVFSNDDSGNSNKTSQGKYVIGFMCTVAASAGYALNLSITQLAFRKILKRETFRVVMNVIIYQSLVATCVILVGLFTNGEWRNLRREMKEYELGNISYVMKLCHKYLRFAHCSGSCRVHFPRKDDWSEVVAMLLANWGFASYIYQHYLDDLESKPESKIVNEVSLVERA